MTPVARWNEKADERRKSRGFPLANFGFRHSDKATVEFIDDLVEQAHAVRQELEPQWYENWGNYRVENDNLGGADKKYPLSSGGINRFELSPVNFLKTPESHQGVNTLRALLLAGLFGTRDYVQADPVGDEDIEAAKRVSRLVMYGLERPGNFRTNFETIGDGLIFGLGSYTALWKTVIRTVPRRFPVPDPTNPQELLRDPQTGAVMTVLQDQKIPVRNDPSLETDDIFDTWYDPAANRFDQLKWKIKRFRIRGDELEGLKNDEEWDSDGINRVLASEPDDHATGPDRTEHPKLLTENLTLEDVKEVSEYGYYGGWVFEGLVPEDVAKEIGGIDPSGTVVLRTINGIKVQAIQSRQKDGDIQGGSITILPTGRGIYGLSPLTVVRYLQDVSDTQMVLTVQALIESVYQNYLLGGDQGPNFAHELETRRPREVFTLQGELDQIAPLPKDYSGLQISVGALNLISQTIRNAMNARDPVQGLQSGGEQTATETQLVASAALQNTDQLAVLIERDELPNMGKVINDLYYINIGDEGEIFRRVGETETTEVNYYDIDAVKDITFVGARSVLSKQARGNQFRDFANILASNPLTMASTDWHEFARRYGDEVLDVRGLERLMIQDPEEIVARMQAMGLANTVGPAAGGAGPDGNAPQKKGRKTPSTGGGKGGNTPAQSAGESS
jgi:hypothetical protein